MNLNFVNGTDLQKDACRTVAHNLLNLPFDAIPLNLTIEFVKDPTPTIHNEFGFAEWTYGSPSGTIRIANIAPNWSEPWRGVPFLQETFAHELAHVFFAALPHTQRLQVVEMFGAKTDDPDVIYDPDKNWEDRVGEGIAETFKDAFLPRRFRRYPNRTKRFISISRYPEFRALFRQVPGDRLKFLDQDDINLYAIESFLAEFPGSFYEPVVTHFENNTQLTASGGTVGFAPKGAVLKARLRPFSLVNGVGPHSFGSTRIFWSFDVPSQPWGRLDIEWAANDNRVGFRHDGNSGEIEAADYLNLEIVEDNSPLSVEGPYSIGREGELRGCNITIPEDIADFEVRADVLALSSADDTRDEDRIASFKTMTEGTGVSVVAPGGSISPGASNGGRVVSPHPVRGG